jgi:hypothetical protein
MRVGFLGFGGAEIGFERAEPEVVARLLGEPLDAGLRRLARITYRISLRSGNPRAISNEVAQGISRWAPMTTPIRLHRP